MSRVGEVPIDVPSGVTVTAEGREIRVRGSGGELTLALRPEIDVTIEDGRVTVVRADDTASSKGFHGLTRTLIANMVEGVAKGFAKVLLIEGVGFRAAIAGKTLSLALGFASPKEYAIPDGITVTEEGGTRLTIIGPDKQKVGQTAARIRSFFPAEPYKGKGIRYQDEHVRRKVGKTVA